MKIVVQGLTNSHKYDENLSDVKALAAKLGVSLDASLPPPTVPKAHKLFWGPERGPDNNLKLWVNGDIAGLRNIEDAARLVEALQPPIADYARR